MPELPEVETIRRQLAPHVEGRRISRFRVLDPRWCAPASPEVVEARVEGRVVAELGRRGKYLVVGLEDGASLALHLRMTGTLLVDPAPEVGHQRVVVDLAGGPTLRFCDPRRFGTGVLLEDPAALAAHLDARLGPEPFDAAFDAARLRAWCAGRRSAIKAVLLDQRCVAGVGNIYADEALHRAAVHPARPAGRVPAGRHAELVEGVRAALRAGIDAGGATIDDFRHVDGVYGGFQHEFRVHRREGLPCPVCGTPVRRMVVAQRGTYACERCQPRPRRTRAEMAAARAAVAAAPRGRRAAG